MVPHMFASFVTVQECSCMSPAMHNIHNGYISRLSIGRVILFALLAGGVAGRAVADASHPKVDPAVESALTQMSNTSTLRVIVRAAAGKYSTLRTRVVGTRRKIDAEHLFINALTAELGKADISMLESDGNAARISLDHTVLSTAVAAQPAPVPIDAGLLATLGLVNSTNTGNGVGVAIVDSGIQPSTYLSPF